MPTQFKIGDVVLLNSGSAAMTITGIGEDGKIYVTWHTPTDVKHDVYPPDALHLKES